MQHGASLIAALAFSSVTLAEPPQLNSLFADHMVLQRDTDCRVWGTASPMANVTVEIAGHAVIATADADGYWLATLEPTPAGGPFTLTATTTSTHGDGIPEAVTFSDVLFGDVWIASGQSNMQWPLNNTDHANRFIADSADNQLRLLSFERRLNKAPQTEPFTDAWSVASPETTPGFSAVAYHFGAMLREELDVPIGLIHSSWGGTLAEAWTPVEALEVGGFTAITDRIAAHDASADTANTRPGCLYNAMIHPMKDLAIAGAIWYQGESNAPRAEQYQTLFPTMIESWRVAFDNPEMPFYFVQLANFMQPSDEPQESAWAELREAQTMALELPHTGMATIIDIGQANDIHPRNKHDVGHRLARLALFDYYGKDIVPTGPVLRGKPGLQTVNTIETRPGKRSYPILIQEAVLEFDFADGLGTTDGHPPRGFEVCAPGKDKPFVKAQARIEDGKVILSVKNLPGIESVRYAWADNPDVNLVNGAGLPAQPFRTDTRPGVTAGRE